MSNTPEGFGGDGWSIGDDGHMVNEGESISDESELLDALMDYFSGYDISTEVSLNDNSWSAPLADIVLEDFKVAVELKKTAYVRDIQKAIGQCVSYDYYGYSPVIIVPDTEAARREDKVEIIKHSGHSYCLYDPPQNL
jgi:hypothetical protein